AIGPRTRAIVLISPNNPTGAIYPPSVIRAFFDVARRARVALVIDETYKDFLPEDGRPHELFADPDWSGTLVHLYSFSKMFALTGYRVGSLTASAAFVTQAHKVMDCVAICAPRLGQEAALYGLGHLGGWVRENTLAMRRRALEFRQALQRLNGLRLVSLGAYFAYLEHPGGGQSDVDVAKRLALGENLLMLPGSTFGPGQERYIRLAFANAPEDAVPAILERLGR
ncbi:MAG: aminotransferase class I/II-fold pyridoxal phosphate-dependent enzyme, partial [Alphaproteobacteria bacterium]|nr:aminotransferase class I/II-fold pyridoxal phosphate-dependent enzyme [Alphaproteobacteria bacterium]